MTPAEKMTLFLTKLERKADELAAEFANIVFEIGAAKVAEEKARQGDACQSSGNTPRSEIFGDIPVLCDWK